MIDPQEEGVEDADEFEGAVTKRTDGLAAWRSDSM